jgi:hypothetical protein
MASFRKSSRLRFSLRTLAILVTLICAYFAAWEATKKYGVAKIRGGSSPMPLMICRNELDLEQTSKGLILTRPRRYYLWLFGPQYMLPFETQWSGDVQSGVFSVPAPATNRSE